MNEARKTIRPEDDDYQVSVVRDGDRVEVRIGRRGRNTSRRSSLTPQESCQLAHALLEATIPLISPKGRFEDQ